MTAPPQPPDASNPLEWAEAEVLRLRNLWVETSMPPGDRRHSKIEDLIPAAEFLKSFAGPDSYFTSRAAALIHGRHVWMQAHRMADTLEGWIAYRKAGLEHDAPFEVRARVEAASDLMEQVGLLLQDGRVHPAAPIVLTGAALEERLRALMEEHKVTLSGKPGLDSYGADLKKASVLDGQEAKQVTAWAGLRNRAAHGEELDALSVQEARIMADGVNFFLLKHALPT